MNEEQDNEVQEEAPSAEPEGPVGGERLALARREQQISVLEVAKELHLDEPKVRALERNEFDVLGAPVFAKGHLRKYAQLVGVDEDDVFTDYYKMTHLADLPPVVVSRPKVRQELSPGPWIAAIVIIIVAIAAYWWFAIASRAPMTEILPADEPAIEEPTGEAAGPASIDVAAEEPDLAAQEPQPQPGVEPIADGQTRLQLRFSGDCWTEISDATGRRLFFNMGRAGRVVELAGEAPFSVLFGNAENVSVLVDGNDYPIRANSPDSRTARLTIINP